MSAEILNAQHNDDTFENIWQELKWRGLVHVSTDEAALEKALSEESLTFYTGYDPTWTGAVRCLLCSCCAMLVSISAWAPW